MKKWLFLVPLLLGLSQFSTGQAVTTLDQNCNLWGAAPATPQCGGSTSAASGTQLFFPDIRGTITNQFEVVVQGTAPGSLTVTVVGCMRGGTCGSTLASSSGTASQIIAPATASLNVYDKYGVTVTWTGGDSTTRFVVNRTGTVAKLSSAGAVGTLSLTAQTADVTSGNTVYAVPANAGGIYRVSCYTVVTVRDPVSSTLPKCYAIFTDKDTSSLENSASQQLTNSSTSNTVGVTGITCAFCAGSTTVSAKGGTAIQVATQGYASNTAATMQFSLYARVEGPF